MNGIVKASAVLLGVMATTSLGACVPDPYSQENGHTTNTQPVDYAPSPPPSPIVETVPAAPSQAVYWQGGHWAWTGTQWTWIAGHYEQRPTQTAGWQPGHWEQSPNGYFWIEGHWQ